MGGANYPNWPTSSAAGYANTAAASLIAYAKANNLDGYDLDFENGLNADWVTQWTSIIFQLGVSSCSVQSHRLHNCGCLTAMGSLLPSTAQASSALLQGQSYSMQLADSFFDILMSLTTPPTVSHSSCVLLGTTCSRESSSALITQYKHELC